MEAPHTNTYIVEYQGKTFLLQLEAYIKLGKLKFNTTIKGVDESHARDNFDRSYPWAEIASITESVTHSERAQTRSI